MRIGRSLLLGTVGSVLTITGAMAADLPPLAAVAAPPPVAAAAPAFDWDGVYFGAYTQAFVAPFGFPLIGVYVGYNIVRGGVIAGIEVEAGLALTGAFEGQLQGHLGAAMGQRGLVYASLGTGWSGIAFWSYGAGLAVGVGESISIFAEVGQWRSFGGATVSTPLLSIGVNWHR